MGISTHILDIARGKPAVDVAVSLQRQTSDGAWHTLGDGRTNADGRVKALLADDAILSNGNYRIQFAVKAYLEATHGSAFFPEVSLTFTVAKADEHYHVPLLLSPFGFSTYRGS